MLKKVIFWWFKGDYSPPTEKKGERGKDREEKKTIERERLRRSTR